MSYVLKKSMIVKVVGLSLLMNLVGCSKNQNYKHQVNNDEEYLNAVSLKALSVPPGVTLPSQSDKYEVPAIALIGRLGKDLDVRPPKKNSALLHDLYVQYNGDSSTLLLESSLQNAHIWLRVISILQAKQIAVAAREDAAQTLITDWVSWNRLDTTSQHKGRYQISVQQQNSQKVLVVKSIELKRKGKDVIESDLSTIQHYNSMMINTIKEALDKQNHLTNLHSTNRFRELDVQSNSDKTALPMLVVHASYTVVWERLPAALEQLGMHIDDINRPNGGMSVTYTKLNRGDLSVLGVKELGLANGHYKLQVGDLNQYTSLQFIDNKGRPLTQLQNDELVSAFKFLFGRFGSK